MYIDSASITVFCFKYVHTYPYILYIRLLTGIHRLYRSVCQRPVNMCKRYLNSVLTPFAKVDSVQGYTYAGIRRILRIREEFFEFNKMCRVLASGLIYEAIFYA